MRIMRKNIFLLFWAALLIFGSSFVGCTKKPAAQTAIAPTPTPPVAPTREPTDGRGVNKGNLAMDFSLEDTNGAKVALSDFAGKVVLINFWVSTCHWCQKEAPLLEKLHQDYKDKGLTILKINIAESKETAKKFMEEYATTSLVLLDSKGLVWFWYSKSRDLPGSPGTPTTFIVDKKGIIQEVILGFRDWGLKENRDIIENLLRE